MQNTTFEELEAKREARKKYPLKKQLAILRELGLDIPDEAAGFEPEARRYVIEFLSILLNTGFGEYDFNNGSGWKFPSKQVLAFDTEVIDIDTMYVDFLKGLQTISESELTFADVEQDNDAVDGDAVTGTVGVEFTINGEKGRFDAAFQGDWLDVRALDAVNACLERAGVEKRFYAAPVDQVIIFFFCTEDWARKFEDATQCFMTASAKGF